MHMQKVPSARRTYLEAQVAERIACVRIVARVAPHQRAAVVQGFGRRGGSPGGFYLLITTVVCIPARASGGLT